MNTKKIVLIGKSSAGKSTFKNYLTSLGYNLIDSSTSNILHNSVKKGSAMILSKKII